MIPSYNTSILSNKTPAMCTWRFTSRGMRQPLGRSSMLILPQPKFCCRCKELKPISDFYIVKGVASRRCKACQSECQSASNRKHVDDVKRRQRIWSNQNPEKVREKSKRYRLSHEDKVQQYNVAYQRKNCELLNAKKRAKRILKKARWGSTVVQVEQECKRAELLGLPSKYSVEEWLRCLEYFDNRCAYCGTPPGLLWSLKICLDHWIPLSDQNCPGTVVGNIVPACYGCNASKRDRAPLDWILSKFGRRRSKVITGRISAYFSDLVAL
jgi:hypothetical protein